MRRKFVICKVEDLLQIAEADLPACLDALHGWVQRTKAVQADAERLQTPVSSPAPFEWTPREKSDLVAARDLSPTTHIRDLGLRPSAMHELMQNRFYALEDFSVETESSLRRFPNVGSSTVASLREMLHSVGLDFKVPTDRYEVARIRAGQARAGSLQTAVADGSSVADLGLKNATISRLLSKQVETVGQLRAATLSDLFVWFGASGRADVMAGLKRHGLELVSKPSGLELWRYKLIKAEDLPMPADDAPTKELRPWLGEVATVLERSIAPTVGDARQLAAGPPQRFRGLGKASWQAVVAFFGAGGHATASPIWPASPSCPSSPPRSAPLAPSSNGFPAGIGRKR